jgi:hypothetical protein
VAWTRILFVYIIDLFIHFPSNSCPAGKFIQTAPCSGPGGCLACPAGHYCPGGQVDAIPCPVGTYSYAGSTNLSSCLPCQVTCTPGYYNVSSLNYGCGSLGTCGICQLCPLGYYCYSNQIYACRINTFNSILGASSISNCTLCPTGVSLTRLVDHVFMIQ